MMEEAIMATGVVLVGLTLVGLLVQSMNHAMIRRSESRTCKRLEVLERDVKRLLALTPVPIPITLADLDKMAPPMREEEIQKILQEMSNIELYKQAS